MVSLKPRLVIIGGICAGVEGKTRIGDLVIGSDMFNYDSKKRRKKGDLADYPFLPIHWDLKTELDSILEDQQLSRSISDEWGRKTGRPEHELEIHLAPFASGSAVVANTDVLEEIKLHQRRVRGLDMEVFGVAKAVHFDSMAKFLAVKSVSDFGDDEKAQDDNPNDIYREYCCAVSASFVRRFLERLPYRSLFNLEDTRSP
jgi:nucleoside phosphorylase